MINRLTNEMPLKKSMCDIFVTKLYGIKFISSLWRMLLQFILVSCDQTLQLNMFIVKGKDLLFTNYTV